MGINCPCLFGPNLWQPINTGIHNLFLSLTRQNIQNRDLYSRDELFQGRMIQGHVIIAALNVDLTMPSYGFVAVKMPGHLATENPSTQLCDQLAAQLAD
jgi:hypothetical protein